MHKSAVFDRQLNRYNIKVIYTNSFKLSKAQFFPTVRVQMINVKKANILNLFSNYIISYFFTKRNRKITKNDFLLQNYFYNVMLNTYKKCACRSKRIKNANFDFIAK